MKQEIQSETARLEARLPNAVLARLKRAAEIQGRTLTDFVVAAADEAACRAIEQTEIIRVSVEDERLIAKAILHPPAPTPALKRAFQRRRKLLGANGGIMKRPHPGAVVCNTVGVASLDQSMKDVANAGGKVVVPKMAIPGIGWLSYAVDTEGNQFGMMQSDPSAK